MEDDIEFSIILQKHGWTTFLLYMKDNIHKFDISSVVSSPLDDFAGLLLSLLNNENEINITWFCEPGWYKIRVARNYSEQHKISVEISQATSETQDLIDRRTNKYISIVSFDIKIKTFLIIGIFQLKKIFHLLHEKSFAKGRENEFPYEIYQKLLTKSAEVFPELIID